MVHCFKVNVSQFRDYRDGYRRSMLVPASLGAIANDFIYIELEEGADNRIKKRYLTWRVDRAGVPFKPFAGTDGRDFVRLFLKPVATLADVVIS